MRIDVHSKNEENRAQTIFDSLFKQIVIDSVALKRFDQCLNHGISLAKFSTIHATKDDDEKHAHQNAMQNEIKCLYIYYTVHAMYAKCSFERKKKKKTSKEFNSLI